MIKDCRLKLVGVWDIHRQKQAFEKCIWADLYKCFTVPIAGIMGYLINKGLSTYIISFMAPILCDMIGSRD